MTLRELHERIAASSPVHWRVLPPGPGWPGDRGALDLRDDSGHRDGSGDGGDLHGARTTEPVPGLAGHTHRAVLRSDVALVLAWGWREPDSDYFDPWLGNLGRMTEVRADRIVLDVLWDGSLVDRLLGLAFREHLLPFPRSRQPRVKGLPERFFPRDESDAWRLVHELTFPGGIAFDRVVHRSGLRIE